MVLLTENTTDKSSLNIRPVRLPSDSQDRCVYRYILSHDAACCTKTQKVRINGSSSVDDTWATRSPSWCTPVSEHDDTWRGSTVVMRG